MRRRIVLASASPRRRDILRENGFLFECRPGNCPEPLLAHLTPSELALRHARSKAVLVAEKHPTRLVLAADTVVALGQTSYGKPTDEADAFNMLSQLSGQTHQVFTAVWIFPAGRKSGAGFVERSDVTFRKLSPSEITEYITNTRPFDKAGAYGAQETVSGIITGIQGSRNNVIGLPIETLVPILRRLGA